MEKMELGAYNTQKFHQWHIKKKREPITVTVFIHVKMVEYINTIINMALNFEDNLKFAVEVGFRRVAACVC